MLQDSSNNFIYMYIYIWILLVIPSAFMPVIMCLVPHICRYLSTSAIRGLAGLGCSSAVACKCITYNGMNIVHLLMVTLHWGSGSVIHINRWDVTSQTIYIIPPYWWVYIFCCRFCYVTVMWGYSLGTLRLQQNGHYFADFLKYIFNKVPVFWLEFHWRMF